MDGIGPTESRGAKIGAVMVVLIVLLESCALAAVALMLRLVLRYWLSADRATAPSVQGARVLQYWTVLLYVHVVALAWWRRAPNRRSALLGFTGVLYLGCGYVFGLTLSSALELRALPEEVKTLSWFALLPITTWASAVLGCLCIWGSLIAWREPKAAALERLPATAGEAPRPQCRAFLPLVLLTLLLVAAVSFEVALRARFVFQGWLSGQAGDRSMDLLGLYLYSAAYLAISLVVLLAAAVCGRRALKKGDADLLWHAGLLALAAGLQQVVLIGLPAVAAGLLALFAARRSRQQR